LAETIFMNFERNPSAICFPPGSRLGGAFYLCCLAAGNFANMRLKRFPTLDLFHSEQKAKYYFCEHDCSTL
jgi:hypothetical protein